MKEIERCIVRAAEALFAERGLDVPWADIAARAEVPPRVVRRYFRNKSLLQDKVLARSLARRWRPHWDALLANREAPLERRLIRFFAEYAHHDGRTATRLMLRTALDDVSAKATTALHAALLRRVVLPIVGELRHELQLPPFAERPADMAEVEIVQALQGAVAHCSVRSHVLEHPVHGNVAELAAMTVRVWLPGARAEMQRLHSAIERGSPRPFPAQVGAGPIIALEDVSEETEALCA